MMSEIPLRPEDLTHQVPRQLARTLNQLIRRNRMVILLRGLGAVCAAAVAALLLVMAIDAGLTPFAMWPRWVLSFSALAGTVTVAVFFLFLPLARSFTLSGVARIIEERHPELEERLSSAVELLTSRDAAELRGSDELIAQLAHEASIGARHVRPRREITFRPARPFVLAAMAVVAIFVGLYSMWPQQTRHQLARALAPWANLPNVQALDLDMSPDRDVTIAEGDRLLVSLGVANRRVGAAEFRLVDAGGIEVPHAMAPMAGESVRMFTYTCPPAAKSFRYRLHAGDAWTQYIHVSVVPRPRIARIDLRYDYPAYTRRKPATVTNFQDIEGGQAKISALAGTTVTISARCNTAVTGAEVLINNASVESRDVTVGSDGRSFSARIHLRPKLLGVCTLRPTWAVTLTDKRAPGEEDQRETRHHIEALDDEKPRADLLVRKVKGKLQLRPTDKLPFGYILTDDHGLASAEVLVRVDNRPRPPIPVKLPAARDEPLRRVAAAATLDLSTLSLDGARQVAFRIKVTDTLPSAKPQYGLSREHTIHLKVEEQSYTVQVTLAQELQIRRTLELVLKEIEETQKDSTPLPKELARQDRLDDNATGRIERIRKHLTTADKALRQLMPQLVGQTYEGLSKTLADLSNNHISKAEGLAGQILYADSKKTRAELADETDFQVDRAHAIVAELLGKFAVMTDIVRRAQELKELAEKQKDLAAARAALENKDNSTLQPGQKPMTAEDIEKAQAEINKRLRELARKTPGLVRAQAASDRKQTENLSQTAQRLAKEQLALAGDTQQAAQLEPVRSAVQQLAAEQAKLAQEAQAPNAPPQAQQAMQAAAKDLRAEQLDQAARQQAKAQQGLQNQGQQLQKDAAVAQLAQQADQMAKQQAQLASAADNAQKQSQAAQANAQNAQQQAQTAKQQGEMAQSQRDAKIAALLKRQRDLAGQAKRIEKQVATDPLAGLAKDTKPSQPMDAAARQLSKKDLPQGLTQAREAARQADALHQQLDQSASQAAKQAADRAKQMADQAKAVHDAAAKARTDAEQARAAAKSAREQAAKSAQATQQAQAAAKAAQADAAQAAEDAKQAQARAQADQQAARQAQSKAQQAAAAAKQPGLTPEQKRAAEQAAQNARNAANQAAQKARASQQAQQAAQSQAQAAAQESMPAQQAAMKAQEQATGDSAKAQAAQKAAWQAYADEKQAARQAVAIRQQAARGPAAHQATREGQQAAATRDAAEKAKLLAQQQKDLAEQIAQAAGEFNKQTAQAQTARQQSQSQAAQQAQAAAEAGKKMAALAPQQEQLKQQADQLAQQAQQVGGAAQQAMQQNNPAGAMQQAAQAQKAQQVPQAAQATAQAAQEANQLAQALKKAAGAGQPSPPTPAQQIQRAAQADQLAKQQADLQRRTAELAKKRQELMAAQEQGQLARLQSEQADIAREAAELSDRVKEQQPQPDRLDTKAARAAEQTGQQIAARQTPQAAQTAQQAAKDMSELAKRLGAEQGPPSGQQGQPSGQQGQPSGQQGKPSGQQGQPSGQQGQPSGQQGQPSGQQGQPSGQPGGKSDQVVVNPEAQGGAAGGESGQQQARLAGDAAGLARRQQRMADQLRDLAAGEPKGVMASRQDQLSDATADLTKKADLLREHADELIRDPASQQSAQQAVGALNKASEHQGRAQSALSKSAGQAVGSQQQSAAQLAAAAQALRRLGQQLQAARQRSKAAEGEQDDQSPLLTDALDQTQKAARSEAPQDAELAAQLLAQLSNQVGQQAQNMGANPSAAGQATGMMPGGAMMPGSDPGMMPGAGGGTGIGPVEGDLTIMQLEELGISPSDWARLRGQLRDDVLQGAGEKSPPQYRSLIRRYFRALARKGRSHSEGGEKPAPPPPPAKKEQPKKK